MTAPLQQERPKARITLPGHYITLSLAGLFLISSAKWWFDGGYWPVAIAVFMAGIAALASASRIHHLTISDGLVRCKNLRGTREMTVESVSSVEVYAFPTLHIKILPDDGGEQPIVLRLYQRIRWAPNLSSTLTTLAKHLDIVSEESVPTGDELKQLAASAGLTEKRSPFWSTSKPPLTSAVQPEPAP